MTEFLLELYSEEIPAGLQQPATEHFAKAFNASMYFYTPQRITIVADLPDIQLDENIERKGPKVGAPEQAMQGFLRSVGVASVDELEVRDGVYFFTKHVKGEKTADYLAKKIPEVLGAYTWPKSMRWGNYDLRWVRPLHSIIAVFGGEVVKFKFAHIESGNKTVGHRFLDSSEFQVSSFEEYLAGLKQRKVVLCANERKAKILEGATKLASGFENDEKLLDEVANLIEFPVPMLGKFDAEFLQVPQECLVATMKKNQKYFPVYANGKLANQFVFVANVTAEDGGAKIIAGNERVVKARLSDAKFFWDQDRKQSLEEFLPKLKTVTFHNKVGNMYERAERISALAGAIAERIGADVELAKRAGLLCKADLVTGMVGEFAELQGLMGGYYADNAEVGEAIKLHYGEPTGNKLAVAVALAEKLDSLIKLWAAGEKPTGSGDPYALRRAALGIIRVILTNNLRLNLREFVDAEVFEFIIERLKNYLKAQEVPFDIVDAVLAQGDDLLSISNKATALKTFLATEQGTKLKAAYKRAANILSIEEKKDSTSYAPKPEEALLVDAAEKDLFAKIASSEPVILSALKSDDFAAALADLASLQTQTDAFFNDVMVNADDAKIRENRLKMLAKIRSFMDSIANFSSLQG